MEFFKRSFNNSNTGLTLLETVIALGILILVLAMVMAGYSSLNDRTRLTYVAKTIESAIRRAEFYGIGVKEFGGKFPHYGIFFGPGLPAASFTLFADIQAPFDQYTGLSEKVETYSLPSGYYIESGGLCGGRRSNPPAECGLTGLNIIFKRPNPEIGLKGELGASTITYDDVEIIITSPRGNTKTVVVWKSGQVSIE